ncbi:UNVERIFIED_CONTAM: hypothetical protein Sangu_2621900 [Sesamum angustifolium]|uniref:Uncharacterized protein n=1 Tax=Sesamum angustifolium TaxID=2727405 RepID=A0AAW2J500_9LAMI
MRRHSLEDEVRRELMMEWGLALWRGSDGFPFGSSPVTTDSPGVLRERSNGRFEAGGFEA